MKALNLLLLASTLSVCPQIVHAQDLTSTVQVQQKQNMVKSNSFYISGITERETLEEYKKQAKWLYNVDLNFSKIKYSKLDKMRRIKISIKNSKHSNEMVFDNSFEIQPIEIILKEDTEGNVSFDIIEIKR